MEKDGAWDEEHGDKRTELVCIGRDLDPEAAAKQLYECLLDDSEMAAGEEYWRLALKDPFKEQWEAEHSHDHDHGQNEHDANLKRLADDMMKGVNEENLRELMDIAGKQGVPTDDIFTFVFVLFGENAVKEIKACSKALKELLSSCVDKRRAQWVILEGVTALVTLEKHGDRMIKKTPTILMALYDIDLIEEDVVLRWHSDKREDDEGKEGERGGRALHQVVKGGGGRGRCGSGGDREGGKGEGEDGGLLSAAARLLGGGQHAAARREGWEGCGGRLRRHEEVIPLRIVMLCCRGHKEAMDQDMMIWIWFGVCTFCVAPTSTPGCPGLQTHRPRSTVRGVYPAHLVVCESMRVCVERGAPDAGGGGTR